MKWIHYLNYKDCTSVSTQSRSEHLACAFARLCYGANRFSDIACITENPSLTELALDGNPLANKSDYRMVIHKMKNLEVLDTRPLTVCYIDHTISSIYPSLLTGGGQDAGSTCDPGGSTRIIKS